MHHHLEIILPPIDGVQEAIAEIMAPFDESSDSYHNKWWDWYVIGGRWAGEHLKAAVDPEKLSQFYADLEDRKITVSGVQCGKQTLQPESQIPLVDELWRQYFPDSELNTCPLFSHFQSQYIDNCMDVDRLGAVPGSLTMARIIFAARNYDNTKYEATFMLEGDVWNGVNYQETSWDGTLESALALFEEKNSWKKEEYLNKIRPNEDWYIATIDYHS